MSLLATGWYLSHCSFVNFPYTPFRAFFIIGCRAFFSHILQSAFL